MLAIKKIGFSMELKRFFVILISLLGFALASAEIQAKTVSDPNHQGWTGKYPAKRLATWKPIKTKCDKCTQIAEQYNETVQELLTSRYWVDNWRTRLTGLKNAPVSKKPGPIGEYEARAMADDMERMERAQSQLELHKNAIFMLEQQAQYLSAALIECEKTACKIKKPSKLKGIKIGGTATTEAYQPDIKATLQQYGINWNGPYRTQCQPCQPIVTQLNALPGWVVRSHMRLQRAEINLEFYATFDQTELFNAVEQGKAELNALKKLFEKLSTELPLCERKFCPALKPEDAGFIPAMGAMPISTCPEPAANEAITVGPNNEIGSKANFKEKTKNKVAGAATKALTGLLGIGGGGGSSKYDGPITERDPIKKKHKLKTKDKDVKRELLTGASFTPEGLLISNDIKKAPGNGTFQTIYLENPRGWRIMPIGIYLYEIWRDWKLSVSWTKDTYVNGEHVKHEEGGWNESWSELLASGEETVYGEVADEGALWEQLGFNTAVSGARSIGTVFPVTEEMLAAEPMNLVVHVTDPKKDPVITYPYVFTMTPGDDGKIQLDRVDQTIASKTPCTANTASPVSYSLEDDPEFSSLLDKTLEDINQGPKGNTETASPESYSLEDDPEFLSLLDKTLEDINQEPKGNAETASPKFFPSPMDDISEDIDEANKSIIESEYGLLDMNLGTMKYQFFDTYEAELPAILTAGSTQERVALTQALIDDATKVYFDNIPSDTSLTEAEQRQHLHTFFSEEMPFLSTLATKESSPLELRAARDSLYENLKEHNPELEKEFDRVLKKRELAYQHSTEGYDFRNESHELKTQRDELTDNGVDENADNIKALDEQINELNRKAEVADRNRDAYNKDADEVLEQIPETERSFLDSHIRYKNKLQAETESKSGLKSIRNNVQGVVPLL